MSRVRATRLLQLAEELTSSERTVIEALAELKLATHQQLATLLRNPARRVGLESEARSARRTLARLTALGIFRRLERRIGGIRAGSAGYIYYLGSPGQRLVAYWQGRGLVKGRHRPEPGSQFVRHRLAVSELYVQAILAQKRGQLDVLDFELEPASWRQMVDSFGGATILKPDAFVRIGAGDFTVSSFVEVDLGSESRSVIARKALAYIDYFNSGIEQAGNDVFPRVVFLTTSEARKAAIVDICAALPPERWELFTVTTLDRGLLAISSDRLARSGEATDV